MSKKLITLIALIILTNSITWLVTTHVVRNENTYDQEYAPLPTPSQTNSPGVTVIGDPIDIRDIPIKVWERHWANTKALPYFIDYDLFFSFVGEEGRTQPVVYKERRISSLEYAPRTTLKGETQLGFMYDVEKDNSTSDVALAIMNIDTEEIKEVYHGSSRTRNWEWVGSDHVMVYHTWGKAFFLALYNKD